MANGTGGERRTEIVEITDELGEDVDIYVTRVRYQGDDYDTIELEGVGQLRGLNVEQATELNDVLTAVLSGGKRVQR